jgi:hypothetical protein
VTDAALITAVFPRNTMKMLARLMGAPIDTARHWLYRHLSAERRREICARLLIEFDRQESERAEIRRQLAEIAEGTGEMACGLGFDGAQRHRHAHQHPGAAAGQERRQGGERDHNGRPEAGELGGSVTPR